MKLLIILLLLTACGTNRTRPNKPTSPVKPLTTLPNDFIGVTIDSQSYAAADALKAHKKKLWTRIVFDEYQPANDYLDFVNYVSANNPIMGELLDSFYVNEYSLSEYKNRAKEYLKVLGDRVHLWEIGNETNGEWAGSGTNVSKKIDAAYDVFKAAGKKMSLTLYYNKGCYEKRDHEMYTWVNKYLSSKVKKGIDYVLVSYYKEDCNNQEANWQEIINKIGRLFPNSKLGIGECGPGEEFMKRNHERKWNVKGVLKQYYTMKINHPRFIGGYFYWYYRQHMSNKGKYWQYLDDIL